LSQETRDMVCARDRIGLVIRVCSRETIMYAANSAAIKMALEKALTLMIMFQSGALEVCITTKPIRWPSDMIRRTVSKQGPICQKLVVPISFRTAIFCGMVVALFSSAKCESSCGVF